MTRNLWRYSHLVLAFSSALFLIVASVSGVILAFEPISQSVKSYDVIPLEGVTLAQTITALQKEHKEVLKVTVTPDDFVTASLVNEQGETVHHYIHPVTGELLGEVTEKSAFFRWVTNLHRSLFLKSIGRFFVGLVSLLLCFIAITGVLLLAQRQGGFLKLYSKVRERDFNQRYHVILGRWLLFPLILVAATGVYLSAEKFHLLPENIDQLDWSVLGNPDVKHKPLNQQKFFAETKLTDVRTVHFPFSDDELDYFEITLRNRDLLVHQHTGEVLSEVTHPFTQLTMRWSLQWHTGAGNILWSIVLAISSASVLFFIVSGAAMYLKRRKKKVPALVLDTVNKSEVILLVGSETGTTILYASALAKALKEKGNTVAMTTLNEYTSYPKAKYLVALTATYGDGDAPRNARKFEHLINKVQQSHPIGFAVVGFGSMDYTKYCQFAITVDTLFNTHLKFNRLQSLFKVNEQSEDEFLKWVTHWNHRTGMNLDVSLKNHKKTIKQSQRFTVKEKTQHNLDDTFLLRLKPDVHSDFQSGDLLNVIALGSHRIRQYSIARIGDDMLLSIKWHRQGICSTFLYTLQEGDILEATIQENDSFYFPQEAPAVWCISNGTGIAPFLGMINNNIDVPVELLWGGKTEASFDLYREAINDSISQNHLLNIQFAFSQTALKMYVQDALKLQQITVAQALNNGTVFMICGSLKMQDTVLAALEEISKTQLNRPLSDFENQQQILTDCY
ncbi:PepSY domain-containing protein [Nonlabens ulvanivorans]|uniref:PepSY domain-containing protein n=1 Tax=Nonlabens ulvanivorans TaxID=906888 RepID=UPI00294245AE|nr:PepSY domain-containing protein [Nonlabens ulvanivorans]WOI21811.1 PepSY domain-containing protein [Nonlabens ulvanivorans]